MTDHVLEIRNVVRTFGEGHTVVHALKGLSIDIDPGEMVAIMGPSGSGKSTLLLLAGGLDSPTTGNVIVDGTDLGSMKPKKLAALRRRSIGFVFQDFNLISTLTAVENVSIPLELSGVSSRTARAQALTALETVNIVDKANYFPDDLAGGEAQRVAIARALIGKRNLLLADEPTGALDSRTADDIMRVLRGRCDAGNSCLMVTHDARSAGWADRVIEIQDGQISSDTGTPITSSNEA